MGTEEAQGSFELLAQVAVVSRRVEQARQFVRGGRLTDTLEAIGDVHLRSAVEHLHQARSSNAPRERLLQATTDLQVAFLAYDKAAGAGPM